MNKLIFETLLAEASFRVAEKTITGISINEAIQEVSAEMELDALETSELSTRMKKAPRPKSKPLPVVEDELEVEELEDNEGSDSNCLVFDNPEDLDTAIGVLMYKGIAWTDKSDCKVCFESADDVKKAKEALNRRWDFINQEPRIVATLNFDNLADYSKILEFMASKKMSVVLSQAELEQDLDLQFEESIQKHKADKKEAKEMGLPAPEAPAELSSFRALRKDTLIDVGSLDAVSDSSARSLHVVKRWK